LDGTGVIDLRHGDCLDILPTLADASVDMVLCDLPYGTTACKWDTVIPFAPLWEQYRRVVKRNGAIVLFGSQPFTSLLITSNLPMFRYEWVWDKHTPTGFMNAKRMPLKQHENILVFYSQQPTYNPQKYLKPYKGARTGAGFTKQDVIMKGGVYGATLKNGSGFRDAFAYPKTIIQAATGNGWDKRANHHPTQKPVALCEYLIRTYTNEGDVVLDNTMGSGTTGVGCVNTGRRFIGIERDEGYYGIAQKRIEAAQSAARQSAFVA
jgi:DNA modification methylase